MHLYRLNSQTSPIRGLTAQNKQWMAALCKRRQTLLRQLPLPGAILRGSSIELFRELERGSFSVARECTEWADSSAYELLLGSAPWWLNPHMLFELVHLARAARHQPVNEQNS
jgi:hypothetical protein